MSSFAAQRMEAHGSWRLSMENSTYILICMGSQNTNQSLCRTPSQDDAAPTFEINAGVDFDPLRLPTRPACCLMLCIEQE